MLILKKIISVFLSICICLFLFTPVCFADDSVYDHTHNWVKEKIHSYSLEYNGVAFGIDVFKCSECALYLHTLKFLGYEVPVIRASPDTALDSEATAMCAQAMVAIFGKEWYATKFEAGGGSASPGGVGRHPSGYAGEGVPNYNSDGELQLVVYPQIQNLNFKDTNLNGYKDSFSYTSEYFLQTYKDYTLTIRNLTDNFRGVRVIYYNSDSYYNSRVLVYRIPSVPVDGYYYFGFNDVRLSSDYTDEHSRTTYIKYNGSFSKHLSVSSDPVTVLSITSSTDSGIQAFSSVSIKFYPIVVNVIPDTVNVKNQTNITINNNTFNGNIYVDNTNKLTYIYPQYTVNNETKISNNPIIYNQENKQYYTYDSVTKNYYYITYGDPAPTPTPSPSPDPGGSTPDPDKPSPSPSPSTAPGGSSDKETGGNSFFNFIFGFGSDTGKDENGKKGIIWSLISLLVSCVTFVVGMGTAYSYLFPFLPPGLCTTIHICVLVLFLFAVIKFIRSFI